MLKLFIRITSTTANFVTTMRLNIIVAWLISPVPMRPCTTEHGSHSQPTCCEWIPPTEGQGRSCLLAQLQILAGACPRQPQRHHQTSIPMRGLWYPLTQQTIKIISPSCQEGAPFCLYLTPKQATLHKMATPSRVVQGSTRHIFMSNDLNEAVTALHLVSYLSWVLHCVVTYLANREYETQMWFSHWFW